MSSFKILKPATGIVLVALSIVSSFTLQAQQKPVSITVDVSKEKGPLKHIWAWFGYDEPNYTYMKDGKKLLSEIAAFSPVPVYVRAHNLMTTGNGEAALKWGSTNMYTEDAAGNPIYQWNIVDSIFDTYVQRKMKPLAQIGFMPEALSSHPQPYRHYWKPGDDYKDICTGWAYPPKDYAKWAELIYRWVLHCVDRYGKAEVESWYWELWNEPDGYYLLTEDRVATYCKMYDYAADAVKRALPTARMGGPHVTGGAQKFMERFIIHCLREPNAVSGKVGAPFNFLAFHAKGAPKVVDNHVQMGMQNQLNDIYKHLRVIASFPETKNIPIIIGESDPEGCAACGMKTNPQNAYRNGTMYSSYTAASIPRIIEMNDSLGTNIIGAVNWSFEFENQPWYYGFRDLATNGVDKPVLNVFRMMAMMKGNRVNVSGDLTFNFNRIIAESVRGPQTDINALASADKNSIGVLVWNYHDDDIHDIGAPVEIMIKNISAKKAILTQYRIDANHSNSYEVWKKMGSPQSPSSSQIAALEKAGNLEMLSKPEKLKINDAKALIHIQLPRQAVSFLKIDLQ